MVLGSLADWGLVTFAAATAYFAYASSKSAQRVEWFIGSIESHSTMQTRMSAKQAGLKVIAYDPKVTRYPARIPLNNEEWHLDAVYLALPLDLRSKGD